MRRLGSINTLHLVHCTSRLYPRIIIKSAHLTIHIQMTNDSSSSSRLLMVVVTIPTRLTTVYLSHKTRFTSKFFVATRQNTLKKLWLRCEFYFNIINNRTTPGSLQVYFRTPNDMDKINRWSFFRAKWFEATHQNR